jgi:hypothetical protein
MTVLHFAYGSNMSRTLMRPRCPQAVEIGPALLPRFRFIITADGYASVLPSPRGVVHGFLWRLSTRDRAAVDAYEQVAAGLYRCRTLAIRCGGRRLDALVYIGRSRTPGRARAGYLDLVVGAARELNLPDDYVASLERWKLSGRRSAGPSPVGEFA